jgi:hypothetical protein
MRRSRKLLVDLIAAGALAALALGAIGWAHTGSTYYTKKWRAGERTQNYGFGDSVPSGNFRDRVENGANQWSALAGNMQFQRGGVTVTWQYDSNCNGAGKNSIHWGSIDGPPVAGQLNTAAQTTHCTYTDDPGFLMLFRMKFDSADPWYNDTGDPPSDKVDTWSLAAHEFGHATGWGAGGAQNHFGDSWDVCTNSPKHTMCPSIPLGDDYWRSLEEHDRDTFNNVYN